MPADRDDACLIDRVVLRDYKSIAACDVSLQPLTFLVGANGSGKSNFLDALRFVSEALRDGLPYALRERGGLSGVLRRTFEGPASCGIRLDFHLPGRGRGHFAFEIGGLPAPTSILREECFISGGRIDQFYRVRTGEVLDSTLPLAPSGVNDRLYLVNASGSPAFKPVFDALSSMSFYNLNPDRIKEILPPDPGAYLSRDGANLPSILGKLGLESGDVKERIEAYLRQIVPGTIGVDSRTMGARETLEFRQFVPAASEERWFTADSMSDGTLRALGTLVALFQGEPEDPRPMLVGLEEPETGLHPAATEVLVDAFREAAEFRQIIVTSHSPDLLDNASISDSEIVAVVAEDGKSSLGPLDQTGRSVLRDHLYTAGQLLRMHQLRPGVEAVGLEADDLDVFGVRESADR
jgi:predicted ATPase